MRKAVPRAALCTVFCTALAGCWGGGPDAGANGVGGLSPQRIQAKARTAAEGANSVRLAGSVVSNGQVVRLDMRLSGDGGIGEVSTKGANFSLLRAGDDLYLKAGDDFWLAQGDDGKGGEPSGTDLAAAKKLDGKYVKVPPDDPAYQQLSGFTEMKVLLGGLLKLDGEVETDGNGEVGDKATVRLTADDGEGGELEVALDGDPFPLRLQRAGGAGELKLLDWNEEFEARAPRREDVVDYGKKITAN